MLYPAITYTASQSWWIKLLYQTWLVKLIELCIKTIHQNGKQTHSFFILCYRFSSATHRLSRYYSSESLQFAKLETGPHTPVNTDTQCSIVQNGADTMSVTTALILALLYALVFTYTLYLRFACISYFVL